jgi:hypothetical protein
MTRRPRLMPNVRPTGGRVIIIRPKRRETPPGFDTGDQDP